MIPVELRHNPYAEAIREVFFEALWPTACIACRRPGVLLCPECRLHLPYIDLWRACRVCGSPFGHIQCCDCNPIALDTFGRENLPFNSCRSALLFEGHAARITTYYKDKGEQRLAALMAHIMFQYARDYAGRSHGDHVAVSFIPATNAAFRTRGFDHAQLLATHLATLMEVPCMNIFDRPQNKDQRALSRSKRSQNMHGRFSVKQGARLPATIFLIDDVYTTGATLIEASDTLVQQGVSAVHCLTFARVL